MKKVLVLSIIFALIGSAGVFAKSRKTKEPQIQSTQGIEIDAETSDKVTKSKNDKHPAKTKRKNRNKYLRDIKKVDRAKNNKRIKERNLDYYNKQLEIKKQKLNELNSMVKKGENQE